MNLNCKKSNINQVRSYLPKITAYSYAKIRTEANAVRNVINQAVVLILEKYASVALRFMNMHTILITEILVNEKQKLTAENKGLQKQRGSCELPVSNTLFI